MYSCLSDNTSFTSSCTYCCRLADYMEGIGRKRHFSPLTVRSLISSHELCSWQLSPEESLPFPHLLIRSSHDTTTLPLTGAQARHCLLATGQTCVPASWHHPPACKKPAFCSVPRGGSPAVPSFFQREPLKSETRVPILPRPPLPMTYVVYMIMSLHFQRVEKEIIFYRFSLHSSSTLLHLLDIHIQL